MRTGWEQLSISGKANEYINITSQYSLNYLRQIFNTNIWGVWHPPPTITHVTKHRQLLVCFTRLGATSRIAVSTIRCARHLRSYLNGSRKLSINQKAGGLHRVEGFCWSLLECAQLLASAGPCDWDLTVHLACALISAPYWPEQTQVGKWWWMAGPQCSWPRLRGCVLLQLIKSKQNAKNYVYGLASLPWEGDNENFCFLKENLWPAYWSSIKPNFKRGVNCLSHLHL